MEAVQAAKQVSRGSMALLKSCNPHTAKAKTWKKKAYTYTAVVHGARHLQILPYEKRDTMRSQALPAAYPTAVCRPKRMLVCPPSPSPGPHTRGLPAFSSLVQSPRTRSSAKCC